MPGVIFERVRKIFPGGSVAVEGLDLEIRAQEFVSLLGPSGCGKTTTLRMIAGLEHPTAGRIRVGERDVTDLPPAKRNVAMVFQSYALYPHMTIEQNIEYPLRKRGVPAAERGAMIAKTLDLLDLTALRARKPRQLSGGQQQRVALGRAIVREPDVFLLDEPLSNLDAKLRAQMRAELIELQRRLSRTMIYVTHDQLEAMTMSHRIAIMSKGVLQQFDTPEAIYRRPANLFVAGFVGSPAMNLIAGRAGETAEGLGFIGDDVRTALPEGHPARLVLPPPGTGLRLGIRPEDVRCVPGEPNAVVALVEPTGHESIVIFRWGGTRLVARVDSETRLAAGENVRLQIRAANVHLFHDDGEGRRVGP
ncbi:MAG: ATP-binding cassette domain-containing protein [Alphaproteobacteria bacterium]|nr:ATP-binding cassette domain-containing protein [Alphaproteobacteria bacterium]